MSILLDTNVLARLAQSSSPHHAIARTAIEILRIRGETLCITPQNLYEFWVICTRPIGAPLNGLGLTPDAAKIELARLRSLFTLLPDTPAVYTEWERLVIQHQVKGKRAHDTRFVVAMCAHGITQLLTFNIPDFSRYPEVQVIDPSNSGGLIGP
jgi:predicted nucleic acid-binding protein